MRRLSFFALSLAFALISSGSISLAAPAPVQISWLGGEAPPVEQGVAWGVPWPKGAVPKDQAFSLTAGGQALPLQTWPLAYWPDGSLKWSAFASIAGPSTTGSLVLSPGAGAAPTTGAKVSVRKTEGHYLIDTGRLHCVIPYYGPYFIESMSVDGRQVGQRGQLVCLLQDGPADDRLHPPRLDRCTGMVTKVTVEQDGPVRATLKIDGMHQVEQTGRQWLPFTLRLYFNAGQTEVRMVYSFVYDGDEKRDMIAGLGATFEVPMREQTQNRHVRFSGEGDGLWSEPVEPMVGRGGRFAADADGDGSDLYPSQLDGERVPNFDKIDARGQGYLSDWAVWNDFKLTQLSADGFNIVKRTNPYSAWVGAGAGKRASGLVMAGDTSGAFGVALKNFWQSPPVSLEVQNANTGTARINVWLWSPDGPAMDMRNYDTNSHGLEASYGGWAPGPNMSYGIGHTNELTLYPLAAIPSRAATVQMAQAASRTSLPVCSPQYYHDQAAFGTWSLPDSSTPFKKAIEDRLASVVDFYLGQIDQRRWYGFWNFGDVMHSYDAARHVWNYDITGLAWDNSELATDIWLWDMFLRTGRADIFRLAEGMARHNGEVDCYHLGTYAGLGSRHNVIQWGGGAKEVRISQSAYRRFYYYLTSDERTGDLMHEMLQANDAIMRWDPMRGAQPVRPGEPKYPTRLRIGPDWFGLVSIWMTEWERTNDPKWRDMILAGAHSLAEMPYGIRSGENLVVGYDGATGKMYQLNDTVGTYNLATIMGGAEVIQELNPLLNDPAWQKTWDQYCRLYAADGATITRDKQTGAEGMDGSGLGGQQSAARLAAYVYQATKKPVFAQAAIGRLAGFANPIAVRHISGPETLNPVDETGVGTNGAAQSSLDAIEVLEVCKDQLPETMPAAPAGGRRGGRAGRGVRGAGRGARGAAAAPANPGTTRGPAAEE